MPPRAIKAPAASNRLLARLPRIDRDRLIAQCEQVQLQESEVLNERGDRIRHVHFPIDSFVSLITPVDDHAGFEVGIIGAEGMLGVSLVLGVDVAPQRALVQGGGSAWRMTKGAFASELKRSPALHRLLDRYLYVLMAQLAQAGACTRFHLLEPRLARWLLMTHDRSVGVEFHLTQDFLGYMLGMRRVGITKAAGALQDQGLISYSRGTISVLDRAGLEAAACACYRIDCDAYATMLGR
jgi:CRP-like cAMP-binding protein